MKKIASLSMVLTFLFLCACSRLSEPAGPVGFQNVGNIATVDYIYAVYGKEYNYSFDLDSGVFYFCYKYENMEDSPEYELEQSEIDAIKAAIAPAEKWPAEYKNRPVFIGMGTIIEAGYNIDIKYTDGTNCVLVGSSTGADEESFIFPEGFEELRSTLDGIVEKRLYGSFTLDKTYSYDGKYYAIVSSGYGSQGEVNITVRSSDDVKIDSFTDSRGYYGICWENDSYNIWVQSSSGATCYSMKNNEWTRNDDASLPDYITGRYVD